jgi:cyclic pyranopterin phosphate synthase
VEQVNDALDRLLAGKPKGHEFRIGAAHPAVERHMSVTGG